MEHLHERAAELLRHTIVGNGTRARVHAPMTPRGNAKYYTVHEPISDDQIAAHLLGEATYAVPLVGSDGLASAGLAEQDAGGIDRARAILRAAEARGVVMFAIVVKGSGGHDGCHPWALYAGRYDPAAIRAQLRQVAEDAGAETDEIHPNNTNIRLPFGLHLRSKSRGRLILQSGETFTLDDPAELEAAEAAIVALPLNAAPPAIFDSIKDKGSVTTPKTLLCNVSGRASLADVKAAFNAAHTWSELLAEFGGVELRGGWQCACGFKHSHDIQIAVTSQDKIVSFSPNCGWAPHRDSGKALDKFGFYVDRKFGGDVVAALKALNPIEPRRKRREEPPPAEPQPARVQTTEQAAEATRKREARRRQAAETIAEVQARASQDASLSDSAQLVLLALLDVAGDRAWCRPSVARIKEMTGVPRRTIFWALDVLEERKYIESSKAPGRTTVRTFLRVQRENAIAPGSIASTDLTPTWGACEGAPDPQPACEPDYTDAGALDCWQWCEDTHGADELAFLDEPTPQVQPEPDPPEVEQPILLPAEVPNPFEMYARLWQRLGRDDQADRVLAEAGPDSTTVEISAIAEIAQPAIPQQKAVSEPAPERHVADTTPEPKNSEDAPGASYDPQADQTRKRRRARKDTKQAAMDAKRRRVARLRAMDAPELTREFYKLKGKIKKCESASQREMLGEILREVEHYRDLAYARRDGPADEDAPASQARARSAPGVQQQAFVGGVL